MLPLAHFLLGFTTHIHRKVGQDRVTVCANSTQRSNWGCNQLSIADLSTFYAGWRENWDFFWPCCNSVLNYIVYLLTIKETHGKKGFVYYWCLNHTSSWLLHSDTRSTFTLMYHSWQIAGFNGLETAVLHKAGFFFMKAVRANDSNLEKESCSSSKGNGNCTFFVLSIKSSRIQRR